MTTLLDRSRPSGLTRSPQPAPQPPSVDTGDDFLHRQPNHDIRHVVIEAPGSWARPRWVDYVESELNQLVALPARWDGRRAQPITIAAVEGLVRMLSLVMSERTAAPQLFPLPEGGIQAEWHIGGNAIEVEVDGAGEAHVLADRVGGEPVAEGVVALDTGDATIATVRRFLTEISSQLLAVR
jgi:hypothetical protein